MAVYDLPEEVEVVLDEGEPSEEHFFGKALPVDEIARLQKAHTKKKNTQGVIERIFDAEAFTLDVFDRTVKRWDGPVFEGAPMLCTLEMKRFMYRYHTDRVTQILKAFNAVAEEIREGTRKNSETSQTGPSA